MQQLLRRPARPAFLAFFLVLALLALTLAQVGVSAPGQAATPITVAQAIATQNGSTATVRGYVVGQPTATSTVVTSGFPNDYALALADAPGETSTARMIYVQIPTAFRSGYGLASNPGLMGQQLDVTGALSAYFTHAGLRNGTAFAVVGSGGGDGGTPTDPAGYYDAAAGRTGTALRSALHGIIDDHTGVSYATVWTALRETDEDPNNPNNVIELYSGTSISKTSNGGDPTTGTASTPGPRATATSAPRPGRAPTCTTCGPPTSPSTPRGATRTSTTAGRPSTSARTASPTPTRSNPPTTSRATSPGCSSTWPCGTRATTAGRTSS